MIGGRADVDVLMTGDGGMRTDRGNATAVSLLVPPSCGFECLGEAGTTNMDLCRDGDLWAVANPDKDIRTVEKGKGGAL